MAPALALVAVSLMAGPTHTAEQAFRNGRNLLQEGKIGEACAAFAESNRLDPALGTLLNLADCEALLGHDARAYSLFLEVLAWSRRAQNAAREQVALGKLAALKPKVALLVIDAEPLAHVRIDRQEVVSGSQCPVQPGRHEVSVTIGDRSATETVEVAAGESLAVKLALPPPSEPPLQPPPVVLAPEPKPEEPELTAPALQPEPEVEQRGSRSGPALLISGAVLLAAGIAGTAWSVTTWQGVQRQQPGGPDFEAPTVTEAQYRSASVVYPVSLVAMGAGVLAGAGGAIFTLSGSF